MARPANTSFKASYSSGGVAFGQGMSLAQALQDRKRSAAPKLSSQAAFHLVNFQLVQNQRLARQIGPLVTLPSTRNGERELFEVSGSGKLRKELKSISQK